MESTFTIDELPNEMLLSIFRMLPAYDFIVTIPQVNKRWSDVIVSDKQTLTKIGIHHVVNNKYIQFFYTNDQIIHLNAIVFRKPIKHCSMVLRTDLSNLGPSLVDTDPYFSERKADLFSNITIIVAVHPTINIYLILFQDIHYDDADPLVPCVQYDRNNLMYKKLAARYNRNGRPNQWDIFNKEGVIECEQTGAIRCEHPGTPCINPNIPPSKANVYLAVFYALKNRSEPRDLQFDPIPPENNDDPNWGLVREDNLNLNLRGEDDLNFNLRENDLDLNLGENDLDPNMRDDNLNPNLGMAELDPNLRAENLPMNFDQLRLMANNYEMLYRNMSVVDLGYLCMTNFKSFVGIKIDLMELKPHDLLVLFEMYMKFYLPSCKTEPEGNHSNPPKNWLMIVGVH